MPTWLIGGLLLGVKGVHIAAALNVLCVPGTAASALVPAGGFVLLWLATTAPVPATIATVTHAAAANFAGAQAIERMMAFEIATAPPAPAAAEVFVATVITSGVSAAGAIV